MIWIFNLFAFLSLDDITYNQINLAVTCGLAQSSADLLTLWPFQCSISVVRSGVQTFRMSARQQEMTTPQAIT